MRKVRGLVTGHLLRLSYMGKMRRWCLMDEKGMGSGFPVPSRSHAVVIHFSPSRTGHPLCSVC